GPVHCFDYPALREHPEGLAGTAIHRHEVRCAPAPGVDPPPPGLSEQRLTGMGCDDIREGWAEELLVPLAVYGELGPGAEDLPGEDVGVPEVDDCVLVGGAEELLRVPHEVLVEGVCKGHQRGKGLP